MIWRKEDVMFYLLFVLNEATRHEEAVAIRSKSPPIFLTYTPAGSQFKFIPQPLYRRIKVVV
jgi:hypothetical protein